MSTINIKNAGPEFEKIIIALNKLGEKADEVVDEFLLKGGKILNDQIKQNINSILTKTTIAQRKASRAKYGIALNKMRIGEIREGGKGKYIVLGILRGDNSNQFYLKFAEYGAANQKKTPFLRPALISNEAKLEGLFFDMIIKSAEEIWGG